MRLLVVFPLTGIDDNGLKQREKRIRKVVGSNVEIEIRTIKDGPLSIENRTDELVASYYIMELLNDVQSIEKQFDGILIWCAGDPAIDALREHYTIPVVGPGQAMITIGNLVSDRYGLITPGRGDGEVIHSLFRQVGLENRLVIKRAMDISVLDIHTNSKKTVDTIVEIGQKMIDNNQVQSIMLGCMGFFGFGKEVEKELNIQIIDPGVVSLNLLMMMVKSNLRFSPVKYPKYERGGLFND